MNVWELREVPDELLDRAAPRETGVRRDAASGRIFYREAWAADDQARAKTAGSVAFRERPPQPEHVQDPGGLRTIMAQAGTLPADRNIGPRRTLRGEEATEEQRAEHAARLLLDALAAAERTAKRLAWTAGYRSVLRADATILAQTLRMLSDEVHSWADDCQVEQRPTS